MSTRRAVATALGRAGLQRPAYRVWEWSRTVPALTELVASGPREGSDGLPLPPPILRVQVSGIARPEEFLAQSYRAAVALRAAVRRAGREIEDFEAVLDFGCGCGRVIRRWADVSGPTFFGSDYNPQLVAWCQENLTFANFEVNQLEPPLPFAEGQFDFVYALSVFTHLTESLQHAWLAELARVIRPGGLLLFTTRGDGWAWKLTPEERNRYDGGELIVRYGDVTGTNLCAAFHPPASVPGLLGEHFRGLESLPVGLADGGQDINVAERRV